MYYQMAAINQKAFYYSYGGGGMGGYSQMEKAAVAESFFKTIKVEWIYGQKFNNQQQAQLSIFEWIESWYNRHRRHSALGYQTIQEYEKNNCNFKNVA